MKIRMTDRLVAALCALLLLAGVALVVTDGFLGMHFLDIFQRLFASQSLVPMICKAVAVVILLVLIIGCLRITFRRRNSRLTVSQQTDNGELAITLQAIEGLVQKCVDTHDELQVSALSLSSERGGLVIDLRASTGSSVSIPLVISALQKQLKQYITACTGLEVKDVRVQVDTAQANVAKSQFDLPDMLGEQLRKKSDEPAESEQKLPHQRVFEGMEERLPEAEAPAAEAAEEPDVEIAAEEETKEEPAENQPTVAEAPEERVEESTPAQDDTEGQENDVLVFGEWGNPEAEDENAQKAREEEAQAEDSEPVVIEALYGSDEEIAGEPVTEDTIDAGI